MVHRTFALTLALLGMGAGAVAQTVNTPALRPGERVRMVRWDAPNDRRWTQGTVTRVSSDTLWLHADGRELTVPLGTVRRLEVSRDRRRNFAKGLGIGFLSGAISGALLGLGDGDDPPCGSDTWFCWRWSAGEKAQMGAFALGTMGAIVGGIVGAATKTDSWVPVGPLTPRLSLGHTGSVTLAAAYRF